jgi:hypothetical protein
VSLDLARRISSLGAETTARLARRGGSVGAARRLVAAAGLVCVVAGIGFLNPALVLCGLGLTTTALLMRRLSWDLALPAGVIALLAVSTVVAVVGGLLEVNLLAAPWVLAALYILYSAAGGYWAARPARQLLTRDAPTGGYGWVAYSTPLVAASIGLAQTVFEHMPASWAFSGTDLAQHMILLQEVQRSGSLDYSADPYPRALHMLLAFASAPNAPLDHPLAFLSYDMRLMAAASWLSLTLVLWTAITLVLRLGDARGAPRLVSVGAALLFGAGLLLTNSFVMTFVYNGAASSLLAVVVIFALPLAVLGLDTRQRRVIAIPATAATSVMLLAHLWQPLAVVPLLAAAAYAAPALRTGWSMLRARRSHGLSRPFAIVATASLALLAVASVPLLSIQAAGGAALAASLGGDIPHVPWLVLLLGLSVAAWLIRGLLLGSTRVYLGSVCGLLCTLAVMLRGANVGFDLHEYYPMKVLWFLTIVLGPIVALAVAGLGLRALRPIWRRLDRLGRLTVISRAALVASVCALGYTFCQQVLVGDASTTLASLGTVRPSAGRTDLSSIGGSSSSRLAIATRYSTRYRPAVTVPVALGLSARRDRYGPYIVSKLISFQTGQPVNGGQRAAVCSDVALATGGSGHAVVITQTDPQVLRRIMAKQGCGDVPVVRIPGGTKTAR